MTQRFFVLILLAIVVAACSEEAEPLPTLGYFESTTIAIDDRELTVAVADSVPERGQGLMGLRDLDGLDGMLFVWPTETEAAFWMKDTLIPLDIAFFRTGGVFVDKLRMEPCTEDPCPLYDAELPYLYAIEAPAGDLDFVGAASRLRIDG